MIPLRLEATNFRGIAHAEIDLTNFDLAAVVGENGTGKSTFFSVCPMFTLFGWLPRGLDFDKVVRTGEQEMSTAINFEHREEIYRVARTYSKKGRGKSTLELQRQAGDRWEPLSGTTIRETEEKIKNLLRLDANTFINSSMILQGGANKYTAALPSERKEVLKKIIGLDIYDQLLEAAKKHATRVDGELEKSKEKQAELDKKLMGRAEAEDEQADVETELVAIATEIETGTKWLQAAEKLIGNSEAKAEKAEELQKQIAGVETEIEGKGKEKEDQQGALTRANNILENEAKIIEKAAEHERVSTKVTTLQAKQPRLTELGAEENRLAGEVERNGRQILRLAPQIREAEAVLANRAELEKAAADYKKALTDLGIQDDLADKWGVLDSQMRTVERKLNKWDNDNEIALRNLKTGIDARKAQTETMDQVSCKESPMADTCPLLEGARKALQEIADSVNEIKRLSLFKNPYIDEWFNHITIRDNLGYGSAEHKKLRDQVNELRPKSEQAVGLETKDQLLKTLQDQKKQFEEQKTGLGEQLEKVKEDAKILAAELEPLAAMELRLPKLAGWVKAKEELPAARQLMTTATETIAKLDREIMSKEDQVKNLIEERNQLVIDTEGLDGDRINAEDCLEIIRSLQARQGDLHGKAGGLKVKIEAFIKDEQDRQQLATSMAPLARELTRWQTLTKAFSRNGIPALIIENAVPELESIASEILSQMTNGQQAIRFETERELKTKEIADTLDIWVDIYDEPEARIYETFSGGEQLRIDFALRFALAELMAKRAGAKIEWLTVDEGLGSQGSKHLPLVLEAIKKVAGRFRKTFVITHVKEAQVFDQIITLEKNSVGVEFKAA